MRRWLKYIPVPSGMGGFEERDRDFSDHARSMGGYDRDDACLTDDSLFKKYFFGYQYGRLERYFEFISEELNKDARILSVASGRCVLELYMNRHGFQDITCSDLDRAECNSNLPLNFIKLNILKDPASSTYDAVICLSLIYHFNNDELDLFFRQVKEWIKTGGMLILDSAGAEDSFLTYLINDIYLYSESWLIKMIKTYVYRIPYDIQIKHDGYRRTDKEIVSIAEKNGFVFERQQNYNFITELRRSVFFNRLVRENSTSERIVQSLIGRRIPYIRMFRFSSVSS